MKEPAPYPLKTVIMMVIVVFALTLILNSVGLFKWAYRLPVESPFRSIFIEVFEPVYTVTRTAGFTTPVTKLQEGYRNFAQVDEGAGFDQNPDELVRKDRYPWFEAGSSTEEVLEAKIVPFDVTAKKDAVSTKNTGTVEVLLIGDSMMKVGFADILQKALESLGNVKVTVFSKNSTGLTRQDYFDWFKQLDKLCSGKKYDLIVLMIGTNDAQGVNSGGKDIYYGTKEWTDLYRSKVNKFASKMSSSASRFYWIGMPPMRDKTFDGKMRTLSKVFEEETAKFANGKFLSGVKILGDSQGNYTAYIKDGQKQVLTRANDGIHFTNGGGDFLTKAVIEVFKLDYKR